MQNNIHIHLSVTYNNSVHPYINKSLSTYLNNIKSEIEIYSNSWDRYKKYTNPYEYIHTSIDGIKLPVCKLKPLSRSYFKMIELYPICNINDNGEIKTFHFAEGPGGFIEALCHIRKNNKDIYYGMTLHDDNDKNVPGWIKTNNFIKNHPNVIIETGKDYKGDITNAENLLYCFNKYNNSIDLVTGDGGVDFSTDFNNQEIVGLKLILCQIAFTIAVQKHNGCCIIKFFDIFTRASVELLYLLSNIYQEVIIVKPNTSRCANSEKYIICKKFRLSNTKYLVEKFYTIIKNFDNEKNIVSILNIDIPYLFISKIQECNAILGQQQIENISNTINLIENQNNNDKINNIKYVNINKCTVWCQKNKLPYNVISEF